MSHQGLGSEMCEGADNLNQKQKYGDLKAPLCLVPWSAIIYLAIAFKEGARKYGSFNWRTKKVESMTYVSATMRHIAAWVDGEEDDSESGNPHLAHALACLAVLVDAQESGNLVDNRPPPGPAPALLARVGVPAIGQPGYAVMAGTEHSIRKYGAFTDRGGPVYAADFDVISEQPS